MLCKCSSHRQSQSGSPPPMGVDQNGKKLTKRTRYATASRSPRAIGSLRVRRVDLLQQSPFPHRVPDPLGGCRPCLPHHEFWAARPDKQLTLLHEKGHYDVITSLPGFFRSSYVCGHSFKPYNNEGQHRCRIKIKCRCCLQKECPDFLYAYPRGLKAPQRCHDWGRNFFGDTCFEAHRSKTHEGKTAEVHQRSICFNRRRCVGCRKLEVGFKNTARHRCGYLDCPSCHEYVNAQTYRCFFQRALSPQEIKEQKQERKRKRQQQGGPPAKRGAAAGLQTFRANEGGDDDSEDDDEPSPLHVFFDIEAMQL